MSRQDFIELIIETEFPSVLIEDVEFMSRKVQQGLSFEAALQALIAYGEQIAPEEKSVIAAAYERLCELESLTDDAIRDAARPITLNIEAEAKERRLLEYQKLFDDPAMAADFAHYRPFAYWEMHEAVCLLLGKDPRRLTPSLISDAPSESPFAARFRELTGMLTRAAELGLIGDKQHVEPSRLVTWSREKGIPVPEALAAAHGQPDTEFQSQGLGHGFQSSSASAVSAHVKQDNFQAELAKEVKDLKKRLRIETSSHSNWRKQTLLIMHGLLHADLNNPLRRSPAKVRDVLHFLDQVLSRNLTEKTVKARMNEIAEMIDGLQRDLDHTGAQEETVKKRNS